MKIYLFNVQTGFYLGEDYADEMAMKAGAFVVPPDATTIAPPRYKPGQIPVFDPTEQQWHIHYSARPASSSNEHCSSVK